MKVSLTVEEIGILPPDMQQAVVDVATADEVSIKQEAGEAVGIGAAETCRFRPARAEDLLNLEYSGRVYPADAAS